MIDNGTRQALAEIKSDIKAGRYKEAFMALNSISDPLDDFTMQIKHASIFKAMPLEALELRALRVAIVADSTVAHLGDVLKYWLGREGLAAEMFISQYNLTQAIIDPESGLYKFKPDVVVILLNYRDVRCEVVPGASHESTISAVKDSVNHYAKLWQVLQRNSSAYIIQSNVDLPDYRVFGNYEGTVPWGDINILRHFNLELTKSVPAGVTVLDLEHISSMYGKKRWHEARYWYHSKHAFAPDATGLLAFELSKIIGSIKGTAKKCLVVDLDNTLWGGIVADDGIEGIVLGDGPAGEAFIDFQKYLLRLKDRGIILAVCSKNDKDIAQEPFHRHPSMLLKLEDIAVFKAGWDNKADSIRGIAEALNIGLDSIVFVDDNPAERQLVRSLLPMVSVPELPQDPSDYVKALSSQSYFEMASFADEDRLRTQYYRDNEARRQFQEKSGNLTEYLQNLRMEATVEDFGDLNLGRVAQLINKTNQFNLTIIRYTEPEVRSMLNDKNKICRCFRLKDRFGDNGVISALVLEKHPDRTLHIDTWVMSCRILARGMEEFICNEAIAIARQNGCERIIGKYIPAKKNGIVSDLYKRLCFCLFKNESGITWWELRLGKDLPAYTTFISKVSPKKAGAIV